MSTTTQRRRVRAHFAGGEQRLVRPGEEVLTLTALKERGWTDGLIRRHLGEEDAWARQRMAEMRLYLRERVEAAEAGAAKADLADAEARRAARTRAQRAADTRWLRRWEERQREEERQEVFVELPDLSVLAHLGDLALESKRHWEDDESVRTRAIHNYVRHHCTRLAYDGEEPRSYDYYIQYMSIGSTSPSGSVSTGRSTTSSPLRGSPV